MAQRETGTRSPRLRLGDTAAVPRTLACLTTRRVFGELHVTGRERVVVTDGHLELLEQRWAPTADHPSARRLVELRGRILRSGGPPVGVRVVLGVASDVGITIELSADAEVDVELGRAILRVLRRELESWARVLTDLG